MLYNILNEIIVEYTANLQKAPYRNITAAENIYCCPIKLFEAKQN